MNIEKRLEMLETELAASRSSARQLKYGTGIFMVLIVVFVIIMVYILTNEKSVIRADEIRAYRFIVEDTHEGADGKQQGIFGMIQDAPGLRLGGGSAPQISLSTHSGTYFYMADETGNPRISMNIVGDRSSLSMFNKNRLDLIDIALSWDEPSMILTDDKGNVLWKAKSDENSSILSKNLKTDH
jgi:hypothetical protein